MQWRSALVSQRRPFTTEEVSGTPPLPELFCWNAIKIAHYDILLSIAAMCYYVRSKINVRTHAVHGYAWRSVGARKPQ